MRAVPQTPSASLPGKQGLSHGAKDSRTTKLRFSLVAILSWKKHKVSPVLTSVISEEAGLGEALQRLDLSSQWSSLPDHLLESIFTLMKDGEKDDWAHVQVALLTWCSKQAHIAAIVHKVGIPVARHFSSPLSPRSSP